MLGIYSLIWTICHKLVWFYQNVVSFHIIFVVTQSEIFSHLGHTGPLTVNKMALPSMYRRIWHHIHAFIGWNTISLRVQRFAAGVNIICLTYATDWWAVIGPVIHGESKSQATREQLGPCGSTSLASCQHVGAWVDSACMSVHYSFVIDGQNSNRIWLFCAFVVRIWLRSWCQIPGCQINTT